MPYIKKERRVDLDNAIEMIQTDLSDKWEGELNYVISRLVGDQFRRERKYSTIAKVCGVLDNVKMEFYRRLAVPYEALAIKKNGDIWEYEEVGDELHGEMSNILEREFEDKLKKGDTA